MRFPFLVLPFLLACSHPAAVAPAPVPSPTPAPKPAPAPDPCAPETGPATQALLAFRAELLAAAAKDPQAFQQSVQDRVAAFQRENRRVLAAHATWSLQRLPTMALPGLETLPDDPRVTADVTDRIRGIVATDADPAGNPLLSYLSLLAFDPLRTFAGIRGAVLSAAGSLGDLERIRENVLEGLAPPRLVRVNDDLSHPVLAMPKRADIFVVWFDRDEQKGVFAPKRIRWVRRDPPAETTPAVATAEDALLSFATAVQASQSEEGDTTFNISTRALDRVGALAKQWLDPHAPLLRRHGACACTKIPRASLPDLSEWKEEDNLLSLLSLTPKFPRLRWDPLQSFLFLRTTIDARTLSVGDYSGLALVDGLVPPPVARANDDANQPVLFLVEGDTAVVVDFSSTPERGFFPTNIRHFRKH